MQPTCSRIADGADPSRTIARLRPSVVAQSPSQRRRGRQTRIAAYRQCPVETLALDARRLRDFCDALSLGQVAQGHQQHTRLVFVFQCRFEVLGCEIRLFPVRRMIASPCEMLALRFMGPLFEIFTVFQCPPNIPGLPPLVARAQKQYAFPADHRVVDTIARSPIDPQFAQSLTQRLAIAKISGRQPVDSHRDLGLGPGVSQPRQPIVEDIFPGTA
jgi:hypothetical protein